MNAAIPQSELTVEYAIIAVYLVFLVLLGFRMKSMVGNVSDYFRSGAKGVWWLVGMSMFISSVSAFTFTGNAGAMFNGGWSLLAIYWGQGMGLLIGALFIAAWFRQMRAITFVDVLRRRFDVRTEQVLAYIKMSTFAFHGALTLYGLALFSSATFGLPLQQTIYVLGVVAVLYSIAGGSWAVMATDFVQGLLMLAMTVVVCVFCLIEVGGIGEFLRVTGEVPDLRAFSNSGDFPILWMATTFTLAVIGQVNLQDAVKYFSVKDGRSARKASFLAFCLISFGSLLWFVPPMTARALFAEEVLAGRSNNPAETAYAFMAARFLPTGMAGLMIIAMFSATMSSLDTALNRNAAIIVRNIVPPLRRLFRKPELADTTALLVGRLMTGLMGCLLVALATIYSKQENFGMTRFYYLFSSIVGMPVALPFLLGLFIKRTPPWAALAAMAAGAVPTIISWISEQYYGEEWSYPFRAALILGFSGAAFLATIPFYRGSSLEYKRRNEDFFKTMHTPVDFEKEIGNATDAAQLQILGRATLALAVFLLLLLALPNPVEGRISIGCMMLFVAAIGGGMLWTARRRERRQAGLSPNVGEAS